MFTRKFLKRLTRFGLCFYIFSYCMAFTVCAEEYPALTPDLGAGIVDEAAYGESADSKAPEKAGADKADEALAEDAADIGPAEDGDALLEEGDVLGAAIPDPDPEPGMNVYSGSSFSGLFNQIWNAVKGIDASSDYDNRYSVALADDIYLDNGTVPYYVNRIGDVTIDARGFCFKGAGIGYANGRSNLNDFHAFRYLTIKNARFTGFDDGVFVHNWVDLGFRYNNLNLINCTFEGNSGTYGPVIYAIQQDYVSLVNCSFINNTASRSGGAI